MMETIVVCVVVTCAVLLGIRLIYRELTGEGEGCAGCGSGCGCAIPGECPETAHDPFKEG